MPPPSHRKLFLSRSEVLSVWRGVLGRTAMGQRRRAGARVRDLGVRVASRQRARAAETEWLPRRGGEGVRGRRVHRCATLRVGAAPGRRARRPHRRCGGCGAAGRARPQRAGTAGSVRAGRLADAAGRQADTRRPRGTRHADARDLAGHRGGGLGPQGRVAAAGAAGVSGVRDLVGPRGGGLGAHRRSDGAAEQARRPRRGAGVAWPWVAVPPRRVPALAGPRPPRRRRHAPAGGTRHANARPGGSAGGTARQVRIDDRQSSRAKDGGSGWGQGVGWVRRASSTRAWRVAWWAPFQ